MSNVQRTRYLPYENKLIATTSKVIYKTALEKMNGILEAGSDI